MFTVFKIVMQNNIVAMYGTDITFNMINLLTSSGAHLPWWLHAIYR